MAGASTARKLKNYGMPASRAGVRGMRPGSGQRSRRPSRGRGYYYGSAAAVPAPAPSPVRRRNPAAGPGIKPAGSRRNSPGIRVKDRGAAPSAEERRRQVKAAVRFIVTAAVAAAMVFAVGVRYSALSAYGYELVEMKARLEQLKDTRDTHHVEVGRLDTAVRVEETATFLLGMDRPAETRPASVARLQAYPGDYPVGRSARVTLPESEGGRAETRMPAIDGPLVERISDWFYAWLAGVGAEAGSRFD